MITSEVIHENLVVVRYLWEIHPINLQSSRAQRFSMVGSLVGLLEANVSKLTQNNQIFRNEFVCSQNHFSKISALIIECKILTSIMLLYT